MRAVLLIALIFSGCTTPLLAQEIDSIKIADAFTQALSFPDKKEVYLKKALNIKRKKKSAYTNEMYTYLHARYLFYTGQFEAAERAVNSHLKLDKTSSGNAKFYNILGTISTMKQDYKKAISWYEQAIERYQINGDKKGAALVKSNIANIFFSLSDFESAYKYANAAYVDLTPYDDTINKPSVLGILSISEAKTNRYKLAEKHGKQTLELSKRYKSLNGIALAHLALGEVAMSNGQNFDAISHYQLTDSIAGLVNNVNLRHLAHVGLLNNYLNIRDYERAKQIGEMALAELKFVTNTTTEYSIRKNLSETYAGLNDFQKAYSLRREADSIYKETSSIKNKEYINELLIRNDTQRKEGELKIERKENLINEAQLRKQGWFLLALSLLLIVALLIFVGYRNLQRTKLGKLATEREKELMRALIDGEEKERERVANELHDGLASDLTGIKMILAQSEEKLPDGILDALSRVHEQTRRISHNLSPLNLEKLGLVMALRTFANENSNKQTNIQLFSSKEQIEINPIEHAVLIYRMIQELIQNALKHAACTSIEVQLIRHNQELTINIEDNGIGFDVKSNETSFGLMNVRKQVELLNGEITIDSHAQKGTVVFISLPLT